MTRELPLLRPPGPPLDDTAADWVDLAEPLRPLVADSRLLTLYDQAIWAEGPVWWPQRSVLAFSDVRGRRLLGWHEDGSVEILCDVTEFGNGNAVDQEGRLVHCEHGRRAISRTEPDGSTHVLTDRVGGRRLNSPNDVAVGPDGAIWFTDPTFGLQDPREGYPATPELDVTGVYRWAGGEPQLMAAFDQPNGLAFAPSGRTLYVTQTPTDGPVGIHELTLDQGRVLRRRLFATVPRGIPDGLTVDSRGWVWSTSGDGIWVFDEAGAVLGLLRTPHLTSNCTFSPDGDRLFITAASTLWCLRLPAISTSG
ncbi:SMP-30/gluconolactonase/LRE family protein [Arsenicicoccus piscis]|uniref:SMP-30/gluconolactonase/LRE family protein n=1 Tax=Arsenicicoccus piscis TaxID=673954 RepID=UPI001F4D2908|nr:SMP-30/gluconolactonase/LRE family protein [Arsenicicoccus piscis]MCH8627668.1 SMP-30/gluconolactonase/LRE family protein [Arsenicicoccus piscis]